MTKTDLNKNCCDGEPGCCTPAVSPIIMEKPARKITIDFLYLDLSVCTRCQGAGTSLDDALAEVAGVLAATGVEAAVNKVNVNTAALAEQYQFISSPAIRIDGRDIQLDVRESLCESCGDLCGDQVDCRVWVYQGQEYTVPPKGMIIEAILKAVYGGQPSAGNEPGAYVMPDNLRNFYAAMTRGIQMSEKPKVLFICSYNSARSQMAEALLRMLYGDRFDSYSAGVAASGVDLYAVQAMEQLGVDISEHCSKSLAELAGMEFDYVVTVCDAAREACPYFPGRQVLHHDFAKPSNQGSEEDIQASYARVRDELRAWIEKQFGTQSPGEDSV